MDAYRREFGSDFEISQAHEDPTLGKRWSRLKTQALINFGNELLWVVQERKPELQTARNLFAPAALDESSEAWLAQSLGLFLDSYDYVALMAMPYLENSDEPDRYLDRLATAVAQHDGGLDRTIFELQTVDWRSGAVVPATVLYEQMRRLQAAGVKHLAYYPDDFIASNPALEQIRQGISLADYPFSHR
jgi:biofilm PGA synthesis lipoprotein PgaB